MSQREQLLEELAQAHDGDPWHGPPRMRVLREIDAAAAAWRPAAGVHSVWELALHMTAWTNEVHRRLRGSDAAEPLEGDWPAVPAERSAEQWRATLAALERAHAELLTTLRGVPESRLAERVRDARDPALGTGVTYAAMLHGLAQHDAYHAGQARLLARLAAASA